MTLFGQMPETFGATFLQIGLPTTVFCSFATKIVGNLINGLVLS